MTYGTPHLEYTKTYQYERRGPKQRPGTSANAVRIQIWTALLAIVLFKLLQFRSRLGWALSNLVALVRWNLFTYRDLWKWLDDPYSHPPNALVSGQLELVWDSTA